MVRKKLGKNFIFHLNLSINPNNYVTIFIGKHLCWILFFNKVTGLQVCNVTKKKLQHRCFPVNIVKFSRTSILKNICERLLRSEVLPLSKKKYWSRGCYKLLPFHYRELRTHWFLKLGLSVCPISLLFHESH